MSYQQEKIVRVERNANCIIYLMGIRSYLLVVVGLQVSHISDLRKQFNLMPHCLCASCIMELKVFILKLHSLPRLWSWCSSRVGEVCYFKKVHLSTRRSPSSAPD
ncbi:uncharacterized protein LOC131011493 [Salvia miltiorrhiza]|uniref:uncharacterized protein LOC131011493 n=1 Tax=Salvia miltiorrhiza TaxID=226208 RepID=UPI0025ABBDCC|nr:uncharacterized protein LOC131011493 [Salvia miltiorrhiza]